MQVWFNVRVDSRTPTRSYIVLFTSPYPPRDERVGIEIFLAGNHGSLDLIARSDHSSSSFVAGEQQHVHTWRLNLMLHAQDSATRVRSPMDDKGHRFVGRDQGRDIIGFHGKGEGADTSAMSLFVQATTQGPEKIWPRETCVVSGLRFRELRGMIRSATPNWTTQGLAAGLLESKQCRLASAKPCPNQSMTHPQDPTNDALSVA